ncbi:YjgN family protein [Pseudoteredinibacter isoporae]|uniref:YjgN family protein n=1 Tax=Pseudoteredinibacter isoporae TaxID=570281 RepID=UPI003107783E
MSDAPETSPTEPNASQPPAPEQPWQLVTFHGTGGEYFRIWIVNLVLTLLTLGIYSAWATVRERRYFYGHTEVAGGRFDFHGKPLQILFGRIIAIVLLIGWSQGALLHSAIPFISAAIVLGLLPMFLVRALGFRLRHTSLRNIRFGFSGKISDAYKALWPYLVALLIAAAGMIYVGNELLAWSADVEERNEQRYQEELETEEAEHYLEESEAELSEYDLTESESEGVLSPDDGWAQQSSDDMDMPEMEEFQRLMGFYGLIMITMAFIFPIFICDVRNFTTRHSQYGRSLFNVDLKRGKFFEHFWIAFGISIAAGLVIMIAGGIVVGIGVAIVLGLGLEFDGSPLMVVLMILAFVFIYGLMIASYMAAYAYWRGRIFNDTFNTLGLGDIEFRSQLSVLAYAKLWVINTLLMVVTLGFAYPWIKIRLLRMQLESIEYRGDSDQFISHNQVHTNAVGDEVGEAFDFDFGF